MSTISGNRSRPTEVSISSAWTSRSPRGRPVGRPEEVLDAAVPLDDLEDAGQLVALDELVQGRLEHPEVAVVVDDDLLAETVVPQAEHDVDQHFLDHFLAEDDRARHADMVVGMPAVHQGRQGQGDRRAALRGLAPHRFGKWLQKRVSMALTVCRPWFSVQPTGMSTMSFLRRSFSMSPRMVV